MQARFTNKIAFVTGGGSGIGAATAQRLAKEGATVIICGRRQAPLDEVVAAIRSDGGKAYAVQADVSNELAFVQAIENTAKEHGGLDIMVNNAMAFSYGSIIDTSTEDWHSNFTTSVDGTFWGTRTAMRLMQETGGAIVNISSICGELGT
ncbi:MAG: SDR family NAD(P)-dependent oxidoreductase, partial [Glaciecola sp.]|nr:SDR family NAD(P)-dependent oxidoreductase [Glaciecola sp.]